MRPDLTSVREQQAGFDPRKCPHLAEKLRYVAERQLDRIKLKIEDEYSRTAFVIADHVRLQRSD